MKTMNEIFSTNLRNMLYTRNKSQVQLAKAVGVTETSVSHWVNGLVVPRSKMVDKICKYLRCSSDDLMVDHSKPVELAPEDVITEELKARPRLFRLIFYAMKLSDEELDALIEQVVRK